MKNLVAKLVIALVVLSGIPTLGLAKTASFSEVITENSAIEAGGFRIYANHNVVHEIFLNRGSAEIILEGDGDTDLDLYVYDNTGMIGRSECRCDSERIPLNIYQSGNFRVQVVNRGNTYNDYYLYVR